MEKEIPLYESIYNKIVNRILVGIYPKGYRLASAQKLHVQYGVGFTSIRRALDLLERDGFIRQEERRRPTVIFDLEEPECRHLRWRIFLSHTSAHLDCYRAIPCLIPGLVLLGARHCTPQLLEALDALCAQPEEKLTSRYELLTLAYTWQTLVVHQAGNGLADDLFLQIKGFDNLLFYALPPKELLPGEVRATLQSLRCWTGLLRRGELEDLHAMISAFSLQAMCSLERALRPLKTLPELSQVRQVEFRWYVRQSPTPLYKKIAWDLLRSAYLDGMQPGDSFPSEAALVERYGVAAVTVRAAVSLLSSLGLVQPVNGVGTLFTGSGSGAGESGPYLRECRESLDILTECAYALAAEAARRLSRQEIAALREELPEYRSGEGVVLWLFRKLVLTIPSHALEDVFQQLELRYLLGLYAAGLPGSPGRRERLESLFLQAQTCLEPLEAGDADGFAHRFSRLCGELRGEVPPIPSGEE